jgi:hypothetical protein
MPVPANCYLYLNFCGVGGIQGAHRLIAFLSQLRESNTPCMISMACGRNAKASSHNTFVREFRSTFGFGFDRFSYQIPTKREDMASYVVIWPVHGPAARAAAPQFGSNSAASAAAAPSSASDRGPAVGTRSHTADAAV